MSSAILETSVDLASRSEVTGKIQLVSFRLGQEEYGIEITKVREIILMGEITRVPETPPYVKGLINLRNTVIPIVDLRIRFSLPEQEITDWSYEYIIHAVVRGETLWSIAKDWYGDNLAWVTIYADNEDLFSTNKGRLSPGMELKIRTSLVGPPSDDQRVSSGATPDF